MIRIVSSNLKKMIGFFVRFLIKEVYLMGAGAPKKLVKLESVTINIVPSIKNKLVTYSNKHNITFSALVRDIINKWVNNKSMRGKI